MRTPVVLGWAAVVAAVAVTVALGAGVEEGFDLSLYSALTVVLATSGLLICSRHPGHRVGRLFWALAAWLAVAELAEAYGARAVSTGWPAGEAGEWIISWSWYTEVAFWGAIFARFPDGRLPGPRFRIAEGLLWTGAAIATVGYALGRDEEEQTFSGGRNPFAVDALPTEALTIVGSTIFMAGLLGAVAALLVRYRRSRGVERQQLKWFASAAALIGVLIPFAVVLWYEWIGVQVLVGLASLSLPVAAGIAILRYRLYEIDVVLNRALVYGALTATLAGTYLASVLVLQLALPARSSLAVAVSTLAVAAAFRPARSRIQAVVDRRFFRARYDAGLTLAAFTARLRDDVSLTAIEDELCGAIAETVQPARVSLWLRETR